MPNVTISVPDELKAEMDNFPEVSWSEICRNAISQYISQRKNPTPSIELDLRYASVTHYSFDTGYPTLSIDLRIHNKMDSEIMIDRILSNATFQDGSHVYAVGKAYDLNKRIISSNSIGETRIHLTLPREKIKELENTFKTTFDCRFRCTVFAEGFRNPYNQDLSARVPIDEWNDVVKKTLKTPQPE